MISFKRYKKTLFKGTRVRVIGTKMVGTVVTSFAPEHWEDGIVHIDGDHPDSQFICQRCDQAVIKND